MASSNEDMQSRLEALEAALAQEKALREEAEARGEEAEARRKEAEARAEEAAKQLAKTTFSDFLSACHNTVFLQLEVQQNPLLCTTGGVTSVDGKQYPCCLKPWTDFGTLHEDTFAFLERVLQQQRFPSPAGLDYLTSKLAGRKLASEEDLNNFEYLAVQGCVLDVIPRLIEFLSSGGATAASSFPYADVDDDIPLATLADISFNYYPFGVVANESDEEESQEPEVEPEQNRQGGRGRGSSSQQEPSRGRTRSRSQLGDDRRRRRRSGPKGKPLIFKDDRPAYLSALSIAKSDMDAVIQRAAAEAEERETKGPPKKRHSPERIKLRPDQWCFRHNTDGIIRPLFVVEYKAAHKIDGAQLRRSLMPEEASSLMEDAIRTCASKYVPEDNSASDKLDIARVLTQTFDYMVNYGLQYGYATTGEAFIFLHLDPEQPTTLYYHLEEPKRAVKSAERGDLKHSAVALVLTFILISMKGKPMTQGWKKSMTSTLRKWPEPYDDMEVTSSSSSEEGASLARTMVVLPVPQGNADACGDPQKYDKRRRDRDGDDDDDDDNYGNNRDIGNSTFKPSRAVQAVAEKGKGRSTRTTRSSSAKGTSNAAATAQGLRQAASVWTYSPEAPLSPTLPYCTQACLLGLKIGGNKDPHCANGGLHRRRRGATGGSHDDDDDDDERHPISIKELRELLIQQLAQDLDHDIHSLEPYGMYGAIGALFKIALSDYGYCFVGKAVQRAHCKRLETEEVVYSFLEAHQGRLVPVNLGVIQLVDEYRTMYGAHMTHMMLMSFSGESLWHHGRRTGNYAIYHEEMLQTLKEMESYGVVHGDVNTRNMVWNAELKRVMVIDFDYAVVGKQRKQPKDDKLDRRHRRRKASEDHYKTPPAKHVKLELQG